MPRRVGDGYVGACGYYAERIVSAVTNQQLAVGWDVAGARPAVGDGRDARPRPG